MPSMDMTLDLVSVMPRIGHRMGFEREVQNSWARRSGSKNAALKLSGYFHSNIGELVDSLWN